MRILLLGKNGQLGYEAHRSLIYSGEVIALDYPDVDFSKPEDVIKVVDEQKPELIYNAVAYTDVDRAESDYKKVMKVNCDTPGEIAAFCKSKNIKLIHISTDYIFDGKKNALYFENDVPNPINIYGKSKLEGEKAIIDSGCDFLIFRTSWVYSLRTGGFVNKVIDWAKEYEELKIVSDQIGNPTWARTLAFFSTFFIGGNSQILIDTIKNYKGVYHLAGGGFASRYQWARSIIDNLQNDSKLKVRQVIPAKTQDFPSPAQRPLFSALDCSKFEKTFEIKIPMWDLLLRLAMNL